MPYRPPKPSPPQVKRAPSPTKIIERGITTRVPEGGWRDSNFNGIRLRRLYRDMGFIQRVAVKAGIQKVSPNLARIFKWQREAVFIEFKKRYFNIVGRRKSSNHDTKNMFEISMDPGPHEALWIDALESVLLESGLEFESVIRNAAQSVIDVTYYGTSLIMGTQRTALTQARLNQRANGIASKITGIEETTRSKFRALLEKGIYGDQFTVAEMFQLLWDNPVSNGMSQSRVATIARTEMGMAADESRKQSIHESGAVTHISVIGCEAREPGSPRYRGESTCNIANVPIADMDKLEFHPNHTGTIVPSKFLEIDPPIQLPPGELT